MGRQIYFTEQEISALRDTSTEWCDMMTTGDEGYIAVSEALDNGLGSALYKLYKGCNGERMYEEYARRRNQNV